jgi:hypothetical protein
MQGIGVDDALISIKAVRELFISSWGNDGDDTHDTNRSSNDIKSLNPPDGAAYVEHRRRRFHLRALWACHAGEFRSFNSPR